MARAVFGVFRAYVLTTDEMSLDAKTKSSWRVAVPASRLLGQSVRKVVAVWRQFRRPRLGPLVRSELRTDKGQTEGANRSNTVR